MARRSGNKSINSLWIFCEGETERNYFTQLKTMERIRRLRKPIVCEDKKVVGLIEYSNGYIKHHKKDFFKGDKIVYVFDRDDNTNKEFDQAKNLIDDLKLISFNPEFILSNPCFEFWILSHFELCSERLYSGLLKRRLLKHLESYKKNDPNIYNNTKGDINTAIENSKKIYQMHINKGVINLLCEESNPSTVVFQLIELIEQYKD